MVMVMVMVMAMAMGVANKNNYLHGVVVRKGDVNN